MAPGESHTFLVDYTVPAGVDPLVNTVTARGNDILVHPDWWVERQDTHTVDVTWTWMTDTSDDRIPQTEFRIVFTPKMSEEGFSYKISATNPGGFYFNMLFHVDSETEIISYLLPEEFVTKGARPIHAYEWTDLDSDGQIDYWLELTDITDSIIDYGTNPIVLSGVEPCTNVLIDIHITYALKGTSGYSYDEAKAFDEFAYDFWAQIDDCESLSSLDANAKVKRVKVPMVFGLALDRNSEETPFAGITFELYNSKGRCVDSCTTDESGIFIFDNLKPGTYTLEIGIPSNVPPEEDAKDWITVKLKLKTGDLIQVNLYIVDGSPEIESQQSNYKAPSEIPGSPVTIIQSPVSSAFSSSPGIEVAKDLDLGMDSYGQVYALGFTVPFLMIVSIFGFGWVMLVLATRKRRKVEPSVSALCMSLSAAAVLSACGSDLVPYPDKGCQ